jgi:hypothetical protein
VRDELVRLGIVITVNDIFLFGGAQWTSRLTLPQS